MADSRRKSRKQKSKPEELPKAQKHKFQHNKYYDTIHKLDCKTPPVPSTSSLTELIKQRESLKKELNSIDSQISCNIQNCNAKSGSLIESYTNKKRCNEVPETQKRKKACNKSPDLYESNLDSEEEEIIIEQRRIKRKQLLEKINSQIVTSAEENDFNPKSLTDKISLHNTPASPNNYTVTKTPEINFVKETTEDMFSEKDFNSKKIFEHVTQDNSNINLFENWDDSEGYYNITIGDEIDNKKYTIRRILGQGVFANVIVAKDNNNKTEVAIKIMRNNELIYKTGLKELAFLKEINEADPDSKYHCVKYITNFMHKGHLCVVIEPLFMDMRKVIKKYGKHGLNVKAVMSYSRQLLLALRHLKKLGIVHADVKPDNILVNEKKNILKLCDFGSACKVNETDATPYLVSRFYRAPEIILGIPYKHSIDVWSAACTIYEMATGKIMFIGSSNNKMLKCFMDLMGKIPSKVLRKGIFKGQHFNYNNNFLLHKKDEISGREKNIEMPNINATRNLFLEFKKAHNNPTAEKETKLLQLKELLDKMLALDSSRRLSITDCLKHPFIQEKL